LVTLFESAEAFIQLHEASLDSLEEVGMILWGRMISLLARPVVGAAWWWQVLSALRHLAAHQFHGTPNFLAMTGEVIRRAGVIVFVLGLVVRPGALMSGFSMVLVVVIMPSAIVFVLGMRLLGLGVFVLILGACLLGFGMIVLVLGVCLLGFGMIVLILGSCLLGFGMIVLVLGSCLLGFGMIVLVLGVCLLGVGVIVLILGSCLLGVGVIVLVLGVRLLGVRVIVFGLSVIMRPRLGEFSVGAFEFRELDEGIILLA
jgi:hypothetical protein